MAATGGRMARVGTTLGPRQQREGDGHRKRDPLPIGNVLLAQEPTGTVLKSYFQAKTQGARHPGAGGHPPLTSPRRFTRPGCTAPCQANRPASRALVGRWGR